MTFGEQWRARFLVLVTLGAVLLLLYYPGWFLVIAIIAAVVAVVVWIVFLAFGEKLAGFLERKTDATRERMIRDEALRRLPVDIKNSFERIHGAAQRGDAQSQYFLGLMYVRSRGSDPLTHICANMADQCSMPKDNVRGYMWLSLSAAQGVQGAAKKCEEIAGSMHASQIEEANRRARAWRPSS
jgi:hypothetical protein